MSLQLKPITTGIVILGGVAVSPTKDKYFIGGWMGISPDGENDAGELFSKYGRARLSRISVTESRICFNVRHDSGAEQAVCELEPDPDQGGYWKGTITSLYTIPVTFHIQESQLKFGP